MNDNIPAGWYPDPTDPSAERYWDGTTWTTAVRAAAANPTEVMSTTPVSSTPITTSAPTPDRSSGRSRSTVLVVLVVVLLLVNAAVLFLWFGGSGDERVSTATVATTPVASAAPATTVPTTKPPATTTPPATTPPTTAPVPTTPPTAPPPPTTTPPPPPTTTIPQFTGTPGLLAIDPLRVSATCVGSPGEEADGTPVYYDPSNVVDGSRLTAWRCATADVLAGSLTIDFGRPVRLTQISLLPGYDKIDPVSGFDRFFQNHRVRGAEWRFSDGSGVTWSYTDTRTLQTISVDVVTTSITLRVLSSWPPIGENPRDFIAVSEIELRGIQ